MESKGYQFNKKSSHFSDTTRDFEIATDEPEGTTIGFGGTHLLFAPTKCKANQLLVRNKCRDKAFFD
jgi:hypothetical protein